MASFVDTCAMRLTHLRVERFRGILLLDWHVPDRLTCLVGPGDSAKTTVLEAVSLLGSTRAAGFSDYDFHGATSGAGPIVIEGVFADMPETLLADNRFGMDLVGVDAGGTIHAEPGEHEPAIRIRLDVDASLEPVWRVISTRNPDGRVLTARDRAALGISRLGDAPERQFNLARGSALARAIAQPDEVAEVLAEAYRGSTIRCAWNRPECARPCGPPRVDHLGTSRCRRGCRPAHDFAGGVADRRRWAHSARRRDSGSGGRSRNTPARCPRNRTWWQRCRQRRVHR